MDKNNIVYALVESDRYEDYGLFFIKINENDKKAFKELVDETTTDWEWCTVIRAWVRDVVLVESEWYEDMEIVPIEDYIKKVYNNKPSNYDFIRTSNDQNSDFIKD